MSKSRSNTERIGVNAVEKIILDWKWIFREQQVSDWGIDAHVEHAEDHSPTGRLLALQIKTGQSHLRKRGDGFVFLGKPRHLEYWTQHSLPVFVVVHVPSERRTYWQHVHRDHIEERERSWTLFFPAENILTDRTKARFLDAVSDARSYRRLMMAIDYATMLELEKHEDSFMKVWHWVNKSFNMRGADIFFGDGDKPKPDLETGRGMAQATLGEFMDFHFPWLAYEYTSNPDLSGSSEATTHDLRIELNDLGKAYLALEHYYSEGRETEDPPEPPGPIEEEMTQEEWAEHRFRCALEQDWDDEWREGQRPDHDAF